MTRNQLAWVLVTVAALLLASFVVVASYAGPEPFEAYRRSDALLFVGGSSALIALWAVWSLGLVAAVWARTFSAWTLLGLLVAIVAIFYLEQCYIGYLDDLEFMLGVRPHWN